ncbi:hypothetical protein [Sphingomonas prati]|uniref:Uncharacterized protein n=1 Tax=Sphingomonas prati TaxID=1843237 RepID=A0A7W9F2N6_9SPHN|nr:hypothetical protein [Sphingomonas prati]MBB5730578.1 hypothetical protein [Sphingomonas prati]GGE95097.1 hypothetical protein GCM10011404_30280 [Sphingomonas prati]
MGDGATETKADKPATWSATIEKRFLEELAGSANVTQSAIAVGTTDKRAWQRRQADAKFRAAFLRALAEGYLRLELRMLQRALARAAGGEAERDAPTSHEERTWLQLLRQHRAAVQATGIFEEIDDLGVVTDRIDEKLSEMKRRLESIAE